MNDENHKSIFYPIEGLALIAGPLLCKNHEVLAINGENPLGGRPTKDYKLTAAFAKKLAMQSGGEKGEQARCYFVACEQALVRKANVILNKNSAIHFCPSRETLATFWQLLFHMV